MEEGNGEGRREEEKKKKDDKSQQVTLRLELGETELHISKKH